MIEINAVKHTNPESYFSIPAKESQQLNTLANAYNTTSNALLAAMIQGQLKNLNNVEDLLQSGSVFSPENSHRVRDKSLQCVQSGFGFLEINDCFLIELSNVINKKRGNNADN